MDTMLLIGTWRVISFSMRGHTTETPGGWAEFSFFNDGTVIYAVTQRGNYITDKIARRWWIDDGRVIIQQEGRLAWNVKHLTKDNMVLSQDNDTVLYNCAKITDESN